MVKNIRVRRALFETQTKIYEFAELIGVSDQPVFRRLRYEQPKEVQDEWIRLINEHAEQRGDRRC